MIAVSKRKERTEKRLQAVLDATERIFADQTFGIPRAIRKLRSFINASAVTRLKEVA